MTKVTAYDTNLTGFSGFQASDSKTDNFKVVPTLPTQSRITGIKFYDTNASGQQDPGELVIPGWRVEKTPPTTPDVTYTDSSGVYQYLVNNDGTVYTITEVPPNPGWFPLGIWQNTTLTSGSATATGSGVNGPNFGNVCLGAGGGLTLGFWSNKNGQADWQRRFPDAHESQ